MTNDDNPVTLYAVAQESMERYIPLYLDLISETDSLANVAPEQLDTPELRHIVLGGIGSPLDGRTVDAEQTCKEWARVRSVPFDVEQAVTRGVYIDLRERAAVLIAELDELSEGFCKFDPQVIFNRPYLLPALLRLTAARSKAELKRLVGSVSDNAISRPAADRLAALLNEREPGRTITQDDLIRSIEPTLEGIVRDLVGRVLLESIVADALTAAGVPYVREEDYKSLNGVVYDFRADFVIPNATTPLAFIEVRKSSSRHASLYAKDKMFSAINWKGQHRELIGVLVTEGPWTTETLQVMSRVIDYVMPMAHVQEVAETLKAYVDGDRSKLRLLVNFSIEQAGQD